MKNLALWAVSALFVAACTPKAEQPTDSGLLRTNFQTEVGGKKTDLYTLRNKNNMEVCVTNFGGRIVSVMVPDKDGKMQDVVLGFDSIQDYISKPSDFGASIGRYANRINQGRFTLDSIEYQLPQNNYGHCLHGGPNGFQYRVFDAVQPNPQEVELTYVAADGEEGFPGNITCKVLMKLTDDNAIDIRYEAETDKPTIVNMTNHSYFNLTGDMSQAGTNMVLYINADNYTPIDSTFIPNGKVKSVYGTPLDFTKRHALYETIGDTSFEQIKYARGYDHNWCLNTYTKGKGNDKIVAASLYAPNTGICLEMFTTEPGVQVYTGNFLDGKVKGKHGIAYPKHASVCLESQKYPDSPNNPNFPSSYIKPGETYISHTAYRFRVK